MDTAMLPPDVAQILAVWPKLPEHIRAAIRTLVQAHAGEKAGDQA